MNASIVFRSVGLCAAMLLAFRAAPAAGQTARMTASATVVERVGIAPGAATVAAARSGHLDVTAQLALHGRAAGVVHVIETDLSDASRPPLSAVLRPTAEADRQPGASYTAHLRIPPAPRGAAGPPRAVTYVLSTIN